MGLIAEFDIDCDALPLTGVAAAVPEATLALELQYNHGERPMFIVTATGGTSRLSSGHSRTPTTFRSGRKSGRPATPAGIRQCRR